MSVLTSSPGLRASAPPTLRLVARVVVPLLVPAVLVLAWWSGSRSIDYELFIAPPLDVLDRTVSDVFGGTAGHLFLGDFTWNHLLPSLWRALAGFGLALLVGVTLGVVLGINPVLEAMAAPLVHLGRSLPTPALLGVFFILFGTGDMPKILLISFGVVWPILFNTIDGVQGIGELRGNVARVFRISRFDVLFRIVLPGASPRILAGARTALSLSLILMIISELQKAKNGLGYWLVFSQRTFDYEAFWSILVILAVVGILFNLALDRIERRVLVWHRGVTSHE